MDSGERLIHSGDPGWVWSHLASEHVCRYLFARPLVRDLRVVDVACGTGYGSRLLGQTAASVLGIDVSPEAIEWANRRPAPRVSYRVGDVLELPFPTASLDAFVSFETIEHVSEPGAALDELRRVLSPGGIGILSTPERAVYNFADHPDGGGNPFHLAELSRDELADLLRTRFAAVELFGQVLVPEFAARSQVSPSGSPAARRGIRGVARSLALRAMPLALTPAFTISRPLEEAFARRSRPTFFPRPLDARPWKYIVAVVRP